MLLVIETKVVIEAPEGTDPEDIASSFNAGYEGALRPFSYQVAEVVHADVTGIRPATDEEEREFSE